MKIMYLQDGKGNILILWSLFLEIKDTGCEMVIMNYYWRKYEKNNINNIRRV